MKKYTAEYDPRVEGVGLVYVDAETLGLPATFTIKQFIDAMPNNTFAHILCSSGAPVTDLPPGAPSGLLSIVRLDITIVSVEYYRDNGPRKWVGDYYNGIWSGWSEVDTTLVV